jgi:predicted RecB family nuclease
MRMFNQTVTFSATDLVNFLGCRHSIYLDMSELSNPSAMSADDSFLALLQAKGLAHEQRYLASLRAQGKEVADLPTDASNRDRVAQTRKAMAAGVDVIYQGALQQGRWHGYADFLVRVAGDSIWGNFHYEPVDTKLSSTAKPKHALQLSVYSRLLATEQGRSPKNMHIVVGDGSTVTLHTDDFHHYGEVARRELETYCDQLPAQSIGEPCSHCTQCRWSARCEQTWAETDHLSLVAGITRGQRDKLTEMGISTMAALATAAPTPRVRGLQPEIFKRIQSQARLQVAKRADGQSRHELLDSIPGKGFARLAVPDAGDLFFDMEGDPLVAGGLEYLFGFVDTVDGAPRFRAFWGHDRAQEKAAFEAAIDLIVSQLERFPAAHVYHYASYEESALKRLAMLHGTREDAVDHLLRTGKLIDLYQVVRESIRVSEPSYSIKNLEVFYMPPRTGEVKSAGASVVMYEEWRQLQEPALLTEIAAYNEVDCVSTLKLRDWLLTLRPLHIEWYQGGAEEGADPERDAKRRETEERTARTQAELLQCPDAERPLRELVGQLLEFHRREAKPAWWAMFHRQDLSEEELTDDAEAIGGLRADPEVAPQPVKKSMVYTFRFPPQDFKLSVGKTPLRAATLESAGDIVALDEDRGRISLKIGPKAPPFEAAFSLIPGGPIDARVLRDAVYRYADTLIAGAEHYPAITSILTRDFPRIGGLAAGDPISDPGANVLESATRAIEALDHSHLLIQGPPGTGKTYLSAHVIVGLLAKGQKIGVASNSHKAINNLLAEIEKQASNRKVTFRGANKCSDDDHEHHGTLIINVRKNEEVRDGHFDLIAGTAWLFSRPELNQGLDYLFIDEAGQVSIANVVAMGLSARNIVLVGDQMQLSQPAQGVHPGDSGRSALEFLLGDRATVPAERGIFLPVTRRMHPDVCRFISEAVYDGRLETEQENATQRMVLNELADPALRSSGISFVPVIHGACSQKSEQEAVRISELYDSLLSQAWIDRHGRKAPITPEDILVVSPYNMQVNHLKSVLPSGARVGTVDKFQGQEAAVVLVSMTTSTAEDISRGMEFLYSRNRLNVAISRAKCLAIVVASPRLFEATCSTVEQLRLVNTLCFVKAYADGLAAGSPTRAQNN